MFKGYMEIDPPPYTSTGLARWKEGDRVLTMMLSCDPKASPGNGGSVAGDWADAAPVCLPSWFSPHTLPYLGSNTRALSLRVPDRLSSLPLHR